MARFFLPFQLRLGGTFVGLNDDGQSISFFPGLSIRTKLATFQTFEYEPVRKHVFKNFVSFSLRSRRHVPSTREHRLDVRPCFPCSYFQLPG